MDPWCWLVFNKPIKVFLHFCGAIRDSPLRSVAWLTMELMAGLRWLETALVTICKVHNIDLLDIMEFVRNTRWCRCCLLYSNHIAITMRQLLEKASSNTRCSSGHTSSSWSIEYVKTEYYVHNDIADSTKLVGESIPIATPTNFRLMTIVEHVRYRSDVQIWWGRHCYPWTVHDTIDILYPLVRPRWVTQVCP